MRGIYAMSNFLAMVAFSGQMSAVEKAHCLLCVGMRPTRR